MKIKQSLLGTLMFLCILVQSSVGQWSPGTSPTRVSIQATLSNQNTGLIKGIQTVKLRVLNGMDPVGVEKSYPGVLFSNGVFNLTFDIRDLVPMQATYMSLATPRLEIGVGGVSANIPLYSSPYSVQARVAETALSVDAASISGTFPSANILGSLTVNNNALFVSGNAIRVGIGTTAPSQTLDVVGIVNATGYKLNGVDLESSFSWTVNGSQLYYDRGVSGFVGVGTVTPNYMLDVAGTVNAREYRINGVNLGTYLQSSLAWQNGVGGSIYFDNGVLGTGGFVGIGTTDPQERLDVVGAIRIGQASSTPKAGTIQYVVSNGVGDFLGYNGTEWLSLTGIRGTGVSGNIAFWKDSKTVAGSTNLTWDPVNSFLGIGTRTPEARLTVRGSGSASTAGIFHVLSPSNQSLFFVNSNGVGIGTTLPTQRLDVNGIVNAQGYRVNGKPLEFALSSDTYWLLENDSRIFYDKGNVGIGTTAPGSLLELSSVTGNPAITFDIAGTNLFTMGIAANNPNAFILAKGGDLTTPVFTFQDQNIGVGLSNPRANLHVSGNLGVIVSGPFGVSDNYTESGRGAKFIFYPARAAIRGGYVLRDEWDLQNIGLHSVSFGYSGLASGYASATLGGFRNIASGQYSVAIGGEQNQALGDYSVAMGRNAVAATRGSFVWKDETPSGDLTVFQSQVENQFLIRANGGVGIGTANTTGAALTVANAEPRSYVLSAKGSAENAIFVMTSSGNVGIGTSDPGQAGLAIVGESRVGIGTTQPDAMLTVVKPLTSTGNLLFIAAQGSPTAALLVTASGNVGIGVTTGYQFDVSDSSVLYVAGGIKASEFKVVDPNDPNQIITIQPNPGSPWADPSKNGGNTFRSSGFVGIGTPSPNNLLELSNRTTNGVRPSLVFDIDGTDQYGITVAMPSASPSQYLLVVGQGGPNVATPSLVVASSSVGIGTDLAVPRATLEVSGNAIISGRAAIGTSNLSGSYALNVGGALNVESLYIKGVLFVNRDTPWTTKDLNIYFTSGNVGIGTSSPAYTLDVAGTIRANSFIATDPITISSGLYSQDLWLLDPTPNAYGRLHVESSALYFTPPGSSVSKTISSPLQKGTGTQGNLGYFVDASTIGQTGIGWNSIESRMTVSGDVLINRSDSRGGMSATANILLGGTQAGLGVTVNLGHDALLTGLRDYTGQKIDVSINRNWGSGSNSPVYIKGLDIDMKTVGGVVVNNAAVVGLNVDVSGVGVSPSDAGKKYAAIFMGGNVGIGTTRPSVELEVAGTVSANYFNLSEGLTVAELSVSAGRPSSNTFLARSVLSSGAYLPRVGIGISNPESTDSELTVAGRVSANQMLISNGLTASTLNINNGSFLVDSQGNIGIGTTTPTSQISILKNITQVESSDIIGQKIQIALSSNQPGNLFSVDRDLTGLNVTMQSDSSSQLASTGTGIRVDMSSLRLDSTGKSIGLDVDVSGSTGTRYAALFNGGYVGIGTSKPVAELHVSGNIKADNLLLAGALTADSATFNGLVVNTAATFNGTATFNRLVVTNSLLANSVTLLTQLSAPRASFSNLVADMVSVNSILTAATLNVASSMVANSAYFSGGVGIGTTVPASGLSVLGGVSAQSMTVSDSLNLDTATLNINAGALYTDSSVARVGIGTTIPQSPLHILTNVFSQYSESDARSWNPLVIQNRSTGLNSATGILFTTDGVVSANSGAGIIAIRSIAGASYQASHLAFVTDPAGQVVGESTELPMVERMRITDAGNVGIGTTTPTSRLSVIGDASFSSSLVAGSIQTSRITAPAGNLILSGTSGVVFNGIASANSDVIFGRGMYFTPVDPSQVTGSIGYARLYVNQTNNGLYYLPPNATSPLNISSAYTGTPGRVPFFDALGNLSDTAFVSWDNASNLLKIGTANAMTSVLMATTLNASAVGQFAIQTIQMQFPDRSIQSLASGSLFSGLDINLIGQSPSGLGTDFGRLGSGEVAVGLNVDMTGLSAFQTLPNGSTAAGYKYAAAFLGGNVGIGTSLPQASLHLLQNGSNVPFRVDTSSRANAFVVASNGSVGMNTATPDASFAIVATSTTGIALDVSDPSGTSLFRVLGDGRVGISTASPSAKFAVNGGVVASSALLGTVSANQLAVGGSNFVVKADGLVGVGTSNPTGALGFYKELSNATYSDQSLVATYVAQKLDLKIGSTQSQSQFYFNKNITLLDVVLASETNSQLGSFGVTIPTVNAVGVSVNLTNLNLAQGATAIGLDVNVTGLDTVGTRYAAIFRGGNVGIGTSTPTSALQVSGDVSATNLIVGGSVQAGSITANRIAVLGDSSFVGTVNVTTLYATTVSANNILLSGNLSVATATFTTINATSLGRFARVGVNVDNPVQALEVSGNTIVSGNLSVGGGLAVSTINAPSGTLTISGTGTLNVSTTVNIGSDLVLSNSGLYFSKLSTTPLATATHGSLYVNADGNLMFLKPSSSTPIGLSSAFTGIADRLAYFDASGSLTYLPNMAWSSANNTLTIGTSNMFTAVQVVSTASAASTGSVVGQLLELGLTDRSAIAGSSTFTGLDLRLQSTNPSEPNAFGALAQGETAVGLQVDVSGLIATQNVGGLGTQGFKYAAAFMGGNVGIGTTRPAASVHVLAPAGNAPLRVDTATASNALYVSPAGFVAVGTANPTAALTVVGSSTSPTGFGLSVQDSAGTPWFVVRNDGRVGIGTTSPNALLEVVGQVSANALVSNGLSVTTLNVGGTNYHFYVNEQGNIGLGTSNPGAGIALSKVLNAASVSTVPESGYVGQTVQLELGQSTAQTQYFFNRNLTGYDVKFVSIGSSYLGDGLASYQATGVSINMSSLLLGSQSRATGVYVNVTGNTGTRYAGIFMGGNVGIGVTNPNLAALQVSGDIRADRLILTDSLTASTITVNTAVVNQSATFNGTVTTNLLVATTVSANNIVMNGTLQVATGSFSTANVTNLAVYSRLGVGTSNVAGAMTVSGDVVVSGNTSVAGTLSVNQIDAYSTTLNILAPVVQFAGSLRTSSDIVATGTILLAPIASVSDDLTNGRLFVDSSGNLNYKTPGSGTTPIPISQSLSGTPNRVAFFGPSGFLVSSADVYWNPTQRSMTVGTGNAMTSLQLVASVNNSSSGTFAAQQIDMRMGAIRSAATTPGTFTGLSIAMTGQNPNAVNDFGRLAQGETAVGLRVDMTTLRGRYSSTDPLGADNQNYGIKYAALFLGGGVGVGTSAPNAALHVASSRASDVVFRVDTAATDYAMVVSGNGFVGIGTSQPAARLSVKGNNATETMMLIQNSDLQTAFSVSSDRVGIATSVPSSTVHVVSQLGLPALRVDAATLPSALVVDSVGNVGVGTDSPGASLAILGASGVSPLRVGVATRPYALFVNSSGYVGVGTSSPLSELHTDGLIVSGVTTTAPSFVSSMAPRGILAVDDTAYTFAGIRNNGGTAESAIVWNTDRLRFIRNNGSDSDLMTLAASGVGIGTTSPAARLEVVGSGDPATPILFTRTSTGLTALTVSSNGFVGIGTSVPSESLHVIGSARFDGTVETSSVVSANTLRISDSVVLSKEFSTASSTGVLQQLNAVVAANTNGDVTGLNLSMVSNPNPGLGNLANYSVWGGAKAIGLAVDLTGINVTAPGSGTTQGYKYAALFQGGYVGVGTTRPSAPLHVVTSLSTNSAGVISGDLVKMGSSNGNLVVRDYDNGVIGFLSNRTGVATEYLTLALSPGSGSDTNGRVGIGLTNPDKALVVNGDVRIGSVTTAGSAPARLYFSGGPIRDVLYDSDNNIPMWMGRVNTFNNSVASSELRVGIGSAQTTYNRFVVGSETGGSFKSVLTVQTNGKVGISDLLGDAFNPTNLLHVSGAKSGSSVYLENHVVAFENTSTDSNGDLLGLQFSGASSMSTDHHFITFYGNSNTSYIGAIQSNAGGTGVRFLSQGADYAEYLEKQNPADQFEVGDIVGVVNGKISKDTTAAQQIMALSYAATVAGNLPPENRKKDYELIAFFGQVKIKVRGGVEAGDYLIASGRNDGTAIAVKRDQMKPSDGVRVVGTAWESSQSAGDSVALVHAAVGFAFSSPPVVADTAGLDQLSSQLKTAQAERQTTYAELTNKMAEQDAQINALIKELNQLKRR